MIEQLKFVQGAVARKDFSPVLTHFRLENRRVLGYNGSLALSSPFPLDLTCSPQAQQLVKAIQLCSDKISVTQMENGDLIIKSGKFKTIVQSSTDAYPSVEPAGHMVAMPGDLIPILKIVRAFVSEDASRTWSRGVLLRQNSAWATNNIILVQRWMGYGFPVDINIPASAVDELIRIGEEPISAQIELDSENRAIAISFHYKDERWMRTSTLSTEWPASVERLLSTESSQKPISSDLWEALEMIKGFVDEQQRVYLNEGLISTTLIPEDGTTIQVSGLSDKGLFGRKYLNMLKDTATRVDFSQWPRPCAFSGDKLRGVIIGMVK